MAAVVPPPRNAHPSAPLSGLLPPSSSHASRPHRSSPLAGPALSRVPSAASRHSNDESCHVGHGTDRTRPRSPASSTLSSTNPAAHPDASTSSFSLPSHGKTKDGDRSKDSSKATAISALNFFRRPPSTVGHSSLGHSSVSHSSVTTHSSILTNGTASTQLTHHSSSSCPPDNAQHALPPFPAPAHTHSRVTSLPSRPGSLRPVSFTDIPPNGRIMDAGSRSSSGSSEIKRPVPMMRSHSATPASPSTYRKSTLSPNTHQRSRTSTNADNWNPLWASTLSATSPSSASTTRSPPPSSKVAPPAGTNNDNKSPFGPAEIPRFSRASLQASGVVMPISAKEWRRRQSIAGPSSSVGPELSAGWSAKKVDKGKRKDRDAQGPVRQHVSFADGAGGGIISASGTASGSSQTPQVALPDTPQVQVQVMVHPPSPISPCPSSSHAFPPEMASSSPLQTSDVPEVVVAPELELTPNVQPAQPLSQKSSTNSFVSCASSPPSPTRSSFVPSPSPTASSISPATSDTSGDEKIAPARPRPRKRHQSAPQGVNAGAGARLSFVDAVMRLSAASFVTAASGGSSDGSAGSGSEDAKEKRVERAAVNGNEDGEGAQGKPVRVRSLDLTSLSHVHDASQDASPSMLVRTASRSSLDHPPSKAPLPSAARHVHVEWVSGAPEDVTVIASVSSPSLGRGSDADVNGGSEECRNLVDKPANDSVDARDEDAGVADEDMEIGRKDMADDQNTPPGAEAIQQQQRKKKLTKTRHTSVPAVTSPSAIPSSTCHVPPSAPSSVHSTLKLASTVLSPIIEDGSSHGHGGGSVSSHGHDDKAKQVGEVVGNARDSVIDGNSSIAVGVALTTLDAAYAKAGAFPSKVGATTKADITVTTASLTTKTHPAPALTKVDASPTKSHDKTASKRYSFRIPSFPFRRSGSKAKGAGEVKDRDSTDSAVGYPGVHKVGAVADLDGIMDTPKKGGKMRKKRGASPTKDGRTSISTPHFNSQVPSHGNSNIAALPQGNSEITLVASPSSYPFPSSHSPSPVAPFSNYGGGIPPSPGSSFMALPPPAGLGSRSSTPGSAASSIRMFTITTRPVTPAIATTTVAAGECGSGEVYAVSALSAEAAVERPDTLHGIDSLCIAHRRSHGHLFEKANQAAVADTRKLLQPALGPMTGSSRPGTASSMLTTSSDAASYTTVPLPMPLPNPWDGVVQVGTTVAVRSPVLEQKVQTQAETYNPCPMCGRCGPLPSLGLYANDSLLVAPAAAASTRIQPQPAARSPPHTNGAVSPTVPYHRSQLPAFPSPSPLLPAHTQPHTPRKLKRPVTAPSSTHKHVSLRKGSGKCDINVSASDVHLPSTLPRVEKEKESKIRGVLRGLFGAT